MIFTDWEDCKKDKWWIHSKTLNAVSCFFSKSNDFDEKIENFKKNIEKKKRIVIMVMGSPASGKTWFIKRYFKKYKYIRVNTMF